MIESLRMIVLVALLTTACGADSAATEQPSPDRTSPAAVLAMEAPGSQNGCPLTIPAQPGFVPPKPYPPQAPDLYQAVWHGTAALWTMLSPEGEIWKGLPRNDGMFTQKTFWWVDGYYWTTEPSPAISVAGRRLDGPESFTAGGPGTNGFREDIGSFMLVGIDIPAAGCWELTARYGTAELSYVVLVEEV